jgi:hypothetical protein
MQLKNYYRVGLKIINNFGNFILIGLMTEELRV